ncbi:MAG: response regulator transcription factor [Actinobacteria bacterium]|nr:response regulator transcription factor [Actinomycetota bacterium]
MKVLLFSGNPETAEKISLNSALKDNEIIIRNIGALTEFKNEKFSLVILDIHEKDSGKENELKPVLQTLYNLNIPLLLIISLQHSRFPAGLLSIIRVLGLKYCDILVWDRLEEELAVRVDFLISRHNTAHSENSITVQDLVLDRDKYEVSVNGKRIELTFKEYELLRVLLENQNKVFSRNKLLATVWGYDFYGGSRTVDVHMRHLRSKLESPYSDMLKTVRNAGYLFTSPVSP